jgi:signal peptidase I
MSHWRWGFWCFVLGAALIVAPFRVVRVVGRSMVPTLQNGQSLLVDRFYYRFTGLFRMDLVVLRRGSEIWVKRLFGLPGDRLALIYQPDGTINPVINLTTGSRRHPGARVITVPAAHIFVLGDNMGIANDSRTVGPLPLADLIGVVRTRSLGRYFPPPTSETLRERVPGLNPGAATGRTPPPAGCRSPAEPGFIRL